LQQGFYRLAALPVTHPSVEKHWRQPATTAYRKCINHIRLSVFWYCWLDDRKGMTYKKPVLLINKGFVLEQVKVD